LFLTQYQTAEGVLECVTLLFEIAVPIKPQCSGWQNGNTSEQRREILGCNPGWTLVREISSFCLSLPGKLHHKRSCNGFTTTTAAAAAAATAATTTTTTTTTTNRYLRNHTIYYREFEKG
jgi:hypothetical protein